MKKLFTLCAAMLMGSAMAFGQVDQTLQFVDKDGNVVADGTTWKVSEKEDGGAFVGTMVSSGLYVKNTSGEAVTCDIDYQVTQISGSTFQICYPGGCSATNEVMDEPSGKVPTEIAAGASEDLQAEWIVKGLGASTETTGTCTVTLQLKVMELIEGTFRYEVKAYGPKITVVFSNEGTTDGIGSVDAATGKKVEAYYSLSGRRLSVPQKGLNIVKFADGTARKVVVK